LHGSAGLRGGRCSAEFRAPDRVNNRIQVFKPDGTFVKEGYIERKTSSAEGTAFDIAFSRSPAAVSIRARREQ
jgi:hypothetical protein